MPMHTEPTGILEIPKFNTRGLEFRDLESIRPILETWIKDRRTGKVINEEVNSTLTYMAESTLEQNDRLYIVAVDELHNVLGVIGLKLPDATMTRFARTLIPAELINAYVSKENRGRGVGFSLILGLEEVARAAGYTEIIFNSGPRYRDTAWSFYDGLSRIGYQRLGLAVGYYGNWDGEKVEIGVEYDEEVGFERGDAPVWGKVL